MNYSISALIIAALWLTMIACQVYKAVVYRDDPELCVVVESEEELSCYWACWDADDCAQGLECWWWLWARDGLCLPREE